MTYYSYKDQQEKMLKTIEALDTLNKAAETHATTIALRIIRELLIERDVLRCHIGKDRRCDCKRKHEEIESEIFKAVSIGRL